MVANSIQSAYQKRLEAGLNKLKLFIGEVESHKQIEAAALPMSDISGNTMQGLIIATLSNANLQGYVPHQIHEVEAIIENSGLNREDTLHISTNVFNRHIAEINKRVVELSKRMSKPNRAIEVERKTQIEMAFLNWRLSIIRDGLMRRLESSGE